MRLSLRLSAFSLAAFLFAFPAHAQLSGTYTLGPGPSDDFDTFAKVTNELATQGVNGPVVIEVAQASYNERVLIGNISGASATNTVTFRGIPSGTVLPIITATPTAGAPFVFNVNRAEWVRLEELRFEVANENQSRGTILLVEADNVIVSDCEVASIDDNSVGAEEAVGIDVGGNNVTIQDTEIANGDIGIRFRQSQNGTTAGGQVFRNTLFGNVSTGLLVEEQAVPNGNAISIRENAVLQNSYTTDGWVGIWLREHTRGAVLARNRVSLSGGTGIRVENVSVSSPDWVSVVNNIIDGGLLGNNVTAGIEVLSADRVRVLNNTVIVNDEDGAVMRVDNLSSDIRLANNILVHGGTGYNLDIEDSASILDHDFQVFLSPDEATKMKVRYDGGVYSEIGDFQDDTGATNSIVWPVEFMSSINLHLAGRSDGDGRLIGQPEPGVSLDFDGEVRNGTRPYRGADEAPTLLADPPPFMNGTYTIDSGGAGDYTSFNGAIADLDLRGVDGPVSVVVASSLFFENIEMGPIPGASPANAIAFVGQVGTPLIRHDAAGFSDGFVLRLYDVEHVTFTRLAFRSQDDIYADVVDIKGGAHITFEECVFIADSPDRGTLLDASGIQYTSRRNARAIRVLNSTFDGGTRAIDFRAILSGEDFIPTGGHEIIGNTISDVKMTLSPTFQSLGISLSSNVAGIVRGNKISAPTSNDNFFGIRVGDGSTATPQSSLLVEQNEVFAQNGTGIRWERYDPDLSPPGTELRVVNNAVRLTGNGPTVGLDIENPEDVLFSHNSISVTSTDPTSAAAHVTIVPQETSATLDLRNNIFDANLGRALDLAVYQLSSRFVYDYNVFASNGTALASYNVGSIHDGDCADLACIQSTNGGSGRDDNSIFKTITFENPGIGNLRLDPSMDGDSDLIAAVIPEVPADIDGDVRSTTDPYRGADERPAVLSFIVADPQIVLQGAYPSGAAIDGTPDAMSTALLTGGQIPLTNPYADASFDGTINEYDGTESVLQSFLNANPTIVDWVVIGLRETAAGPDVARRAVFLRSDAQLLDLDASRGARFSGRAAGEYYIVVYHRNHLPTMTAQTESVTSTLVDSFVQMYRSAEIYGGASGAELLEDGGAFNLYGMIAGDGNADGSVLADDRQAVWLPTVGQTGYLRGDFNLDTNVLADDRQSLWAPNVGRQSAVPGASIRPSGEVVEERSE